METLPYFYNEVHKSYPACGTFQDDQGDTLLLVVSALSFEVYPFVSFVLHSGASRWVTGPELPKGPYFGPNPIIDFNALTSKNLGLGQLFMTFAHSGAVFSDFDVFQLTPDGRSWMALGQFTGINLVAAATDLSLLCD